MAYSREQLFELSKKVGRSWRTLQYWAAQGCDLNNSASLEAFLQAKELRKTNVQKSRERRGIHQPVRTRSSKQAPVATERHRPMPNGNGEAAVEKTGAQFALRRLESEEANAQERLQQALAAGNQLEVEQAQMFWVRCVESLRKLDLSIELARRNLEEMVPKRLACDVALAIADWLRIFGNNVSLLRNWSINGDPRSR